MGKMNQLKTVFLISLFILSLVNAASIPKKSQFDSRMRTISYNANDVTTLYTKLGYTTALKFGEDERIIDIASGFTDGYHLIDRSNILFISPKPYVSNISTGNGSEAIPIAPTAKEWKTNLIVITNKRDYVFDLLLDEIVFYKVSFTYPDEIKAAKEKQKDILNVLAAKNKIKKELNKVTVPRNWDFYMNINKGSKDIAPNFAYDDGVFTYLGFDNTKTIPSVFKFENKKESILNTHIKKDGKFDVLVVHNTTPMIILRSGEKIVGILNNSYGKNPTLTPKTTISKDVEREVIDEQ